MHFGNIGTNEYRITYKTKIDHLPEKGETFTNYAKLTENEVSRVSQTGGGELNNMLLKFIKKMKQASV